MNRRRVVLCMGQYCNMNRRAKPLHKLLETEIIEINGDEFPGPVKLEIANCLSMCGAGPNLMLYPQAQMVNGLDEAKLRRVIQEKLKPNSISI